MRRARLLASLAVVPLLALSGCGAQSGATSPGDFSGADKPVAQVIADLGDAAAKGDGAAICSRVLSGALADRMAAGRDSCGDQVESTIGDADDLTLDTRRIDVSGATATAIVEDGKGAQTTLRLVRERGGWRVDSL